MTKEKWFEIFNKEHAKVCASFKQVGPDNWEFNAKQLSAWIKDIDKLTEVYNMENGVTDGN